MSEYANKYLDATGVKHLWDKANEIFIKQQEGKGLSDENFTAVEKEKLLDSAARYGKSPYGKHLKAVAEGKVRY